MNAKKCDRCGKYYDSYGINNDPNNTNAIMFVNADKDGRYFSHEVIDLCPECKNEVKEFVDNKHGNKNNLEVNNAK